ncbi:Glycosyltransferase involved in cell wall bisynthesis [Mucilaginibacter gossypiicola]|uniref:Glycosyltransferase involved in cell wall bisynthesis n=1 Tax=Mucilaginibacter gossypiicola TaxID=551995 RepID=A0A1H8TDD0_9SPHI|nr:glycosyltransferase [Mucilaginibacter gossypiicola]SEO88508.1 Glycosyltransferase involved in cell wall bisynthesis [Mucilaginibacter gossypiicola]
MEQYNLCIIKPNKDAFSETFIQAHIDGLAGNKKVLYGGAFPVYDHEGKTLIRSKLGLLSYLIQKRIFKKKNIKVRTRALYKYFKEHKIDVVFAEYGMVGASVTEACKMAAVPLIIHFHGADVYHRDTVAAYAGLYQDAFKYASAFIAVSVDMAATLKEMGAPANKVFTASCGVDTAAFPLLDISSSAKDFLFVGRFVEKKSPQSLVKAFKMMFEQHTDARLWMAGGGPLFDETQELIAELGLNEQITLTGVLKPEEIRELMKRMRAFVQHSVTAANGDKEGTPVTVLEASSSGLPVVSTRHSGIKEAVIDKQTGFLVDEYDIEGMAERMTSLAGSVELAVQMGKAARSHMIANYDIHMRIALLDSIIQSSITNKN